MATPRQYFDSVISQLSEIENEGLLKIVRIGTRVPISNPRLVKPWHYQLLKKINIPYLMIHVNHPSELTEKALFVLNKFRIKSQAIIMSQSVLLKGVNDDVETLSHLFNKLVINGVRPYYLYQNDPVPWARHFTIPIKRAIRLWQQLRPRLSGLAATARFVIDTPYGDGKIPIPEGGSWKVNYHTFYDFKGKSHRLIP